MWFSGRSIYFQTLKLGVGSDGRAREDVDGDQYWLKFKGEDKMQVSLNLRALEVVFKTILDFFSVFTDQTLSCLIQRKVPFHTRWDL